MIPDVVVIAAALPAAYWLLKARKFKTCRRCGGIGHLVRRLGAPKTCRACHGTGLRSRTQRRKARRLFADQNPGRTPR
jgi:DnaJ-class molecular chaperone